MASLSKPSVDGNTPATAITISSRFDSSANELTGSSPSVQNAEEESNRELKRQARNEPSSTLEAEHPCTILELPQDVKSIIMSFQAHKDRLSLAATCGDFWKAVEAFSERKLDEFRLNHPSRDEEWETRIIDQSSVDTEMPRPLELPYRYLLWRAFRTYLYSFGGMPDGMRCVQALPDGKRVVTLGDDNVLRLWDLSTKTNEVFFDASHLHREPFGELLVSGRHIIAIFDRTLYVLSHDGKLVHTAETDYVIDTRRMALGNKRLFFATDGDDTISYLDLVSGALHEDAFTWDVAFFPHEESCTYDITVCANMLIAARFEVADEVCGIYVFDPEDFSQKQFLPGYHSNSLVRAIDDENIVVAERGRDIVVMALDEEGLLFERFSFSLPWDRMRRWVKLIYQSLAYVRAYDANNNKVEVYNILNGELVRTCDYSLFYGASAERKELFVGADARNGNNILAYSAHTN